MEFEIESPKNITELCKTIKSYRSKSFRFGAGYTDLLMELKKHTPRNLTVINLAQLKDVSFSSIRSTTKNIQIGAMITASKLVTDTRIEQLFPVLQQAAHNLASTQIRQVATLGGNMCTASPSGDLICAAMALQASCEIMNDDKKIHNLSIQDFFIGVRKTALKKNEFLFAINIPRNKKRTATLHSGFIKIGTRKSMECSVVSLAFHLQIDKTGKIIDAGIAIGASAPTVKFAQSACQFLIGKKINSFSEKEKEEFANKVLSYASPISDIRATAWYRKEVLFNISKGVLE
ncbi:MAG: FAD binding domain-containing protein [Flavobacteriales bacterium]|nr:FAD binding domain-containing protein [Flavobacteriales bacterium]